LWQIFLSLRILEFRDKGFSDVESIKLGFAFSAGTITTAGLIMAISFGFLLLAPQQILGQWGFFIGERWQPEHFLVEVGVVQVDLMLQALLIPCTTLAVGGGV
jgi:hypothetical protein